jgi:hypothetical protein
MGGRCVLMSLVRLVTPRKFMDGIHVVVLEGEMSS